MAELNEREQTIVNLINQLADVANDETTTQDAIDGILEKIQHESNENIKDDMAKIENTPEIHSQSNGVDEQQRMMNDIHQAKVRKSFSSQYPLLFTRIREVKKPMKAHPTDAGIDFFVPDLKAWNDDFKETVKKYSNNKIIDGLDGEKLDGIKFENGVLEVAPGAHVAIPSGIKTIIPQGLAMMMVNKSGVATKLKLDHSACLIDSEYRDELIFCFFNHNHIDPVKIEPGMKITQGLIVPVININLQECLNCVYDEIGKDTDRGGGFGSSGSH